MSDSHHQQWTAGSQKRTSIFQEHLQEDTLMSTHQTKPTPPQSPAASISLQSEGTSRQGCGLWFPPRFMAKQRKLNERMQSQIQQEAHRQRYFCKWGKLRTPSPDSSLGSTSTMVSGPASEPSFPDPISPVKLPGPLLLHHPEMADSGVQLPQLVSIPALPSFGEPSSPGQLRRGGNNQRRSHPRKRSLSSGSSCSGDVVVQSGTPQQNVGHLTQREASVHSMAGIICSAEEYDASEGIDNSLYGVEAFKKELDDCIGGTPALEAWWTASVDHARAPRAQDTAALGIFAQPICNGFCGPVVQDAPSAPYGRFDDDEEPYFPHEGMQFVLPRRRPREKRREVYWVD